VNRFGSGRILIAGVARSGTTWVGRVLEKASGTVLVNEPDNRTANWFADVGTQRLGFVPVLVPGETAHRYGVMWDVAFRGGWPQNPRVDLLGKAAMRVPRVARGAALAALGRRVARIPADARIVVCKSVYVPFALEWVVSRAGARPVIVRRHPLNVVASWNELGVPPYPLQDDPRVRKLVLEPLGVPDPPQPASQLQRVAWCIGVLDAAIEAARRRHPEWIAVSHEELCDQPIERFRRLFEQLDLDWTDAAERYVGVANRPGEGYLTERVSSELPDSWQRRLTEAQVSEAEGVLAGFPGYAVAADVRANR
jgi:hypothetical protein